MMLLGNALLSQLWDSRKYRVLPFPGGRGAHEIIEVYPGATLRRMGLASYKSRPDEAVRIGIAACAAAGIKLDVELRLIAPLLSLQLRREDARLRRRRCLRRPLHCDPPCRGRVSSGHRQRSHLAGAPPEGMGRRHLGPHHRQQFL
jgi:hypothetical protein